MLFIDESRHKFFNVCSKKAQRKFLPLIKVPFCYLFSLNQNDFVFSFQIFHLFMTKNGYAFVDIFQKKSVTGPHQALHCNSTRTKGGLATERPASRMSRMHSWIWKSSRTRRWFVFLPRLRWRWKISRGKNLLATLSSEKWRVRQSSSDLSASFMPKVRNVPLVDGGTPVFPPSFTEHEPWIGTKSRR